MKIARYTAYQQFFYLPLAIILAILVIQAFHLPIGDFGNYYYASKFLVEGNWGIWIYDPASFNLKIHELGQRHFFLNYTPVPPFSAILYVPFALINSPEWAKLIWNIINCFLLILAIYRLNKHYPIPSFFWWVFPILFFLPLRNTLYEGQSYFLILYLLAEGFIQYQKSSLWLMAALWALAIHLKISPAFVLLFLLFNKEYKGALALMLVGFGILIVSLPVLSFSLWYQYLASILPRLFNGDINHTYALNYQSAQVLLKTIFVPDKLHNTNAWFSNPEMYHKLLLTFKVVIMGITLVASFSKIQQTTKFSFWLMCSFLISGYGNSFGLLLMVLPTIYLFPLFDANKVLMALFFVCLVIILNVPFYWFSHLAVPFRFPRLYALLAILVILLIAGQIKLKWHYGFAVLLAMFWPVDYEPYIQNYLFEKEETLLTYDFTVADNAIVINGFDTDGPFEKKVPLGFPVYELQWITPSKNTSQLREKSCIINDSLMLYLSDKNRGVGFYTIRKKKMNTALK